MKDASASFFYAHNIIFYKSGVFFDLLQFLVVRKYKKIKGGDIMSRLRTLIIIYLVISFIEGILSIIKAVLIEAIINQVKK